MGVVNEEKIEKVVYVNVSNAFKNFFCEIFTDKLIKYGLHKWTVKWTEILKKFQA